MIEFLLSNLLTIIPLLLSMVGIGYGTFQKSGANKAKAEAALQKVKAESEKTRAELSEAILDVVIKSNQEAEKAVKDAKLKASIDRNHFS